MASTTVSDVIVPEIFTAYVQQMTQQKSRLVQSGLLPVEAVLNALLAGGGLTFNVPSWQDLPNTAENVSTDNSGSSSTPNNILTSQEIAVRLSRNNSWGSMNLAAALAGDDPMRAIGDRVSDYWVRRLQAAFIAVNNGIFAMNALPPAGQSTHVQNDMTVDISGGGYVPGVTDFSAEAFIDATLTMGDSMDNLIAVAVHSVVYSRMQKNNLIDFIPDARGETNIPTFLGRQVIIDDGIPASGGVYETWIYGDNAFGLGNTAPDNATETDRKPEHGDGGGEDILYNRVQWTIHPIGHAYVGTPPNGGPDNTANANMLAAATSWERRYPERKQINIARLITRES